MVSLSRIQQFEGWGELSVLSLELKGRIGFQGLGFRVHGPEVIGCGGALVFSPEWTQKVTVNLTPRM